MTTLRKYLSPTKSRIKRTVCLLLIPFGAMAQPAFLDSLMRQELTAYQQVLARPSAYRLQIAYTRIDREQNGKPRLSHFYYRPGREYIYPASTVKLPMAILALEKLEQPSLQGLDKRTAFLSDSMACRRAVTADTSSPTGRPNIAHYIKKMLLVSDNSAFARCYDFVGFKSAHQLLQQMQFPSVRLLNRLEATCPADSLPSTPAVYFLNTVGDTLFKQPQEKVTEILPHPVLGSSAGAYHQSKGKWVKGPKDFSKHNYLSVQDLHRMMVGLVLGSQLSGDEHFELSNENRLFLLKQLGSWPRESEHPVYDPKTYYDSYKKYFMYGAAIPVITQDSLRVFNIVGRAYGFLIDCAYIVDLKNNLEFFLTCAIYVNKNGRIGSGKYEYEQVGLPFLRDLSLSIYNYERARKRSVLPDLSELSALFQN